MSTSYCIRNNKANGEFGLTSSRSPGLRSTVQLGRKKALSRLEQAFFFLTHRANIFLEGAWWKLVEKRLAGHSVFRRPAVRKKPSPVRRRLLSEPVTAT
jgi:hypothetical protein